MHAGANSGYILPSSQEMLRRRPLRLVARPWRERRFTYDRYGALLDRLAAPGRFHIVPLCEFRDAPADRPVIALRHDVDDRLESAIRFAELERARGIRSTYFILHTAPYYGTTVRGRAEHDPALLPALRYLQNDLGHEIGFHHDLVTLERVFAIEPGPYLAGELDWLREAGIAVSGCAAHGSHWAHRHGYHNSYAFLGWDEPQAGHPAVAIGWKLDPADFGLDYDAGHLNETRYFTDAVQDDRGRRWHPDILDLEAFVPGDRVIVLVHSCHWDRSLAAKAFRTYGHGVRKLLGHGRRI